MPLNDKYLKYSPEITFEIFTLVWDKLIKDKFIPVHDIKNAWLQFSGRFNYFWCLIKNKPNQFDSPRIGEKETTVQEILGYDPFVKEFILPKEWMVVVTLDNMSIINNWKVKQEFVIPLTMVGRVSENGGFYSFDEYPNKPKNHTEITFEQFKKYVLKEPKLIKEQESVIVLGSQKDWTKATPEELLEEAKRRYPVECIVKCLSTGSHEKIDTTFFEINGYNDYTRIIVSNYDATRVYKQGKWAEIISLPEVKEAIPEYVECVIDTWSDNDLNLGKIFKVEIGKDGGYYIHGYCIKNSISWNRNFKPSTKEAFDAQNQPIEKWSVGSYVVLLQDWGVNTKGDIQIIKSFDSFFVHTTTPFNILDNECKLILDQQAKWFATKSEAERFAKTLQIEAFESDKEFKQPLEQAVHCTTQEEWDFVCSKIKSHLLNSKHWKIYTDRTCWTLFDDCCTTLQWCADNKQQILSFQEWEELNGYKMEKTTLNEIKSLSDLKDKMILSAEKTKNQKFEVGKWYKNLGHDSDYIGKFKRLEGLNFYCEGYIRMNKYCNDSGNLTTSTARAIECPAEEIQQYLPDNHPDKLPLKTDIKSLSIGELHKQGLVKRFFEEVIKVDFDSLPKGNLCSYKNFASKGCVLLDCDDCYLKNSRRDKLKSLLEIKEKSGVISNQEFKVGDYITGKDGNLPFEVKYVQKIDSECVCYDDDNRQNIKRIRHATPEEINEYLITEHPKEDKIYYAVHCTTQEEWDFACEKLNRKSFCNFKELGDSIYIKTPGSSCFKASKPADTKFLSFQEWCLKNKYEYPMRETNSYIQQMEFWSEIAANSMGIRRSAMMVDIHIQKNRTADHYFPEVVELNFD